MRYREYACSSHPVPVIEALPWGPPGFQAAQLCGVVSFSIYEGQEELGGASTGGHRKNDRVRERQRKISDLL